MENNDLAIRQMPGTEQLLTDYLKQAVIEEDTVYALLYIPAFSPRQEAQIRVFPQLLKHVSPHSKTLLISICEDKGAAMRYNRDKKYNADYYLYDTQEAYRKIFSFDMVDIYGTYVLKLCPKEGKVITGGQPTVYGRAFARQLVDCKNPMPQVKYHPNDGLTTSQKPTIAPAGKMPKWHVESLPLVPGDDYYVSNVWSLPSFEGDYFFFNDDYNAGIEVFRRDGRALRFNGLVTPDSTERCHYVQVTEQEYRRQDGLGMLAYIPLTAELTDGNKLNVMFSLPYLKYEDLAVDSSTAYYNDAAIISRDIRTLKKYPLTEVDVDPESSPYFYRNYYFHSFAGRLWMGCSKITWPLDGLEKDDYAHDVTLNPFDDRFYDTPNPIVAAFNPATGTFTGHYGHLEASQRKSRTGYYFLYNVFAHHGRQLMYANGYTGIVYVADSSNVGQPVDHYNVFDIDLDKLPEPDSTMFYTLEYAGNYHEAFSRCVDALRFDDKRVYALVRYGQPNTAKSPTDRYTFVVVDRRSGKRKEYLLPDVPQGRALGHGLRIEAGGVSPFVFVKKSDGCEVITYRL